MIAGSSQLARARVLGVEVLDASLEAVTTAITARAPTLPFGYLVTPNADHLARLEAGDEPLALCYADAEARVFDSRFLARVGRMCGLAMPSVVTGSDLTDQLLQSLAPDTAITVIGTTADAVTQLRTTRGLTNVDHLCLPFGFDPDSPDMIGRAVDALQRRPARLVLFACGSPRQEILARHIARAGGVTGFGLCIGSAVDQLGGHTRRAPHWLRASGFEWVWRIVAEPRRLLPRYLKSTRAIAAMLRQRVRPAPYGVGPDRGVA